MVVCLPFADYAMFSGCGKFSILFLLFRFLEMLFGWV
jgi:ABC-type transport system involved in Fe-S cluster assembly fused permease/ATPase subunit